MPQIDPRQQHWHIFLNPKAAAGRAEKQWPTLYQKLKTIISNHSLHISQRPKHLTELAKEAITTQNARYLLVVGGDGAIHEVVNGMNQQDQVPSKDLVVALLPLGTGNDWIKTHKIPRSYQEWEVQFLAGHLHWQDLGKVDYDKNGQKASSYFINAAGFAFDGYVVRYANQVKWRWMGHRFFYLWAITISLFKYKLRPALLRFNNQAIEDHFYTISCGLGNYSGGGMQITPHAQVGDNQLALTIAGRLNPLTVMLNTYRFYNGTIGDHSKVQLHQTKEFTVEATSEAPILLEADGEFLGTAPAKVQIIPEGLKFIAPKL